MARTPLVCFVTAACLCTAAVGSAQPYSARQQIVGVYESGFGKSVDIDGDTAVVGAADFNGGPNLENLGTAYVYVRSGTTWTLQQRLVASDGRWSDTFGSAVAISGNRIVVGAERAAGTFNYRLGAAYIFERTGTTWVQTAKLTASDGTSADLFGQSVDIDGDFVVVGAPAAHRVNTPLTESGAAYVYERTASGWTEQRLVTGVRREQLGRQVSVSGTTICVATSAEPLGNAYNVGGAYIFERTAFWGLQLRLQSPAAGPESRFGSSCAVGGDTLVVGASGEDAAYVYSRAGNWSLQHVLRSPSGDDHFGMGARVHGDSLAVGAMPPNSPGSIAVFDRTGTSWVHRQRIQPNNGIGSDGVGYAGSFGFSPQWLFVGAFELHRLAVYGVGSSTGTPPGTPRNFAAAASGNTLMLSWDPPASGGAPSGYTLRARTPAGALIAGAPVGLATRFSTPAPNGIYVLTVQASNAAGASPESASRTVTLPVVPALPGSPTNLAASAEGNTVRFTWSPPASGGPVVNYVLLAGLTPQFSATVAALPLPAAPASFVVGGVPAGTYYVRLVAQNAGGTGAASNEAVVTVVGPQPPGAPSLNPGTVTGDTVSLSWSAGVGAAPTGYVLRASATPGGAPIAVVPLGGTTAAFAGVPPGTYYVSLTAVNAIGSSPPSNEVRLVVP